PDSRCKNVVVITDSITVNAIWYRSEADYFLAPNELSAAVLRAGGITPKKIKTFGFPVSPKFADLAPNRSMFVPGSRPRILYVINAGKRRAPELVKKLLALEVDLTVTIVRDEKLRRVVQQATGDHKIDIFGWTDELPRMLCESHLLIGKAGGATVQETMAARCPMIVNHVVSGQEEGNAHLIQQSNSGASARRRFRRHGDRLVQWDIDAACHRANEIDHTRGAARKRRTIGEQTNAAFNDAVVTVEGKPRSFGQTSSGGRIGHETNSPASFG